MRIVVATLAALVCAAFVLGCGGGPKTMQSTSEGDMPEWYTSVPTDPNYLLAANTASSQDMQLALDKATTAARAEIGRQVELKVNAMQKKFDEETGMGQDAQLLQQFTSATKIVVSTSLSGSKVRHQKQLKDGTMWRAYVLTEYPIGAANEALLQAIKKNQEIFTRLRASQAFKELDDEVTKYEEAKKTQEQK
ncbi:MAG: hypothetical protein AAB209_06110 [Bacteroidota bacterium]|jgi:hypothetical protein